MHKKLAEQIVTLDFSGLTIQTTITPPPPEKTNGLQGVPWKNFSRNGLSLGKREDSSKGKMIEDSEKQTDKSEPIRKSKRVPKKCVFDDAFDDGIEDEKIRYLE
ncbi:hypothetical protein NE237_023555 [Protea cynaroides]|uniref:Uncharacterized protein n=1 Tax=Protea cynaroides TaxID=273540 RepID=A0A9Q0K596_9MAGN|nr:hypothetical protein NE237_023555 [Protea cynaroides]